MGVQPTLPFHIIGVSHHAAPVEERERFAFSSSDISTLLDSLRVSGLFGLVLSTCNRCELYWYGTGNGEGWFRDLVLSRGQSAAPRVTRHAGVAAVRHLFRVSAGLDSQILGETEILGQIRRAYDAARAAGTTSRDMDLIFSAALSAGRRVRRETVLGRHPHSVSSAAVELALQQLDRNGRIIVLGAGEAAEGILRALHQYGASRVTLLNRHPEKAGVLASAWGAATGSWDELDRSLARADLVLVATGSRRPVITASQLSRVAADRGEQHLLVVDLSVPRNVEPTARGIHGIQLLDLDDLQRLCCPAAGIPADLAEPAAIIEDELVRLGSSLHGRIVAPRLAELHRLSQTMAEQESAWALAQLESLSEAQREIVRQMAERLVRRVLYPVSRSIREEADTDV